MKIVRIPAGNITILALTGEFDQVNLLTINEKIDALIQTGCTELVFNLRGFEFIDSSALGYMIGTQKRLTECGGKLVLSEPSELFRTTLGTLGFDRIFAMFPTDEQAIAYLGWSDEHPGC